MLSVLTYLVIKSNWRKSEGKRSIQGIAEVKCKENGEGWCGTNVMITYDATKMDGAYSDGIINNTPLFHQKLVNI